MNQETIAQLITALEPFERVAARFADERDHDMAQVSVGIIRPILKALAAVKSASDNLAPVFGVEFTEVFMLKTRQNGRPIFWNGHLCEGDRMIDRDPGTFLLWTRCGKHDVPANAAWEKRAEDMVECAECAAIVMAEAAQEPRAPVVRRR